MNVRVCAVVVTYNRSKFLKKCIESLLAQTYVLDSIIIVNNASTDDTATMLNDNFPKLTTIHLQENTGSSGGFYVGTKAALKQGFDWIWLMDDDVSPEFTCLEDLLSADEIYRVRIPLRLAPNSDRVVELAATKFDLRNPLIREPRRSWVAKEYPSAENVPETLIVQDFAFEGPLISREIFQSCGFPNPDYFIYGDDTDYSIRIRKAQYQIVLIGKAHLIKQIETSYSDSPFRAYYRYRNSWRLHNLYGENVAVRWIKPSWLLFAFLLHSILTRQYWKIPVIFRAFRDALFGRMGKRF